MQKVLKELFDQFVKTNGREPDNLEMILLRQKASTEDIRKRKIISMFDRSPVDADKPILGGQNIQETDAQILERLNKGNEDSLNRLKNKKDEPDEMATGGRAGYYGGGAAMVGEDLSEIGHGSDSLMARNMQLAPNSMATTSTGLNYLLGEDNDTVRVPYNEGKMVLPKPKPAQNPLVELSRIYKTYEEAMPGVSKDTQQFLRNDFIQKLQDAKISQEEFMTYRMQNNLADGGRIGYNKAGIVSEEDPTKIIEKKMQEKLKPFIPKSEKEIKKEEENEMFKMVEEFKTLKKKGIIDRNLPFRTFKKMKEKELLKNKLIELDLKYPDKKILDENGLVNKENAKEAIDAAIIDLEIEPIDGLKLQRSVNTEGEQSVTGGEYTMGNFNFSSPNLEEGILKTDAAFNIGDLNLTGSANTNDSKLLNSKLGFNYNGELKGKMFNEDGYRSTELDLNKTFPINDKFNLNLSGKADTSTFDGKTYRSSDLTPKLSYNDGIFNTSLSKEILEGGNEPNLSAGVNYNNFYAKGNDLLSEDRSGVLGYQKEFGNKDGDLFFTAGAEKNIFDDEYTGGVGLKYKFAEGGPARQGFKMGKRAFLKLMGGVGAGIASLKTGLLGFGKEGGKKVAKEVVKEATGAPPAYFFKLVDKIRKLGDDAPKLAVKDKENVTTYKDYTLTEDITTGETTIQRMKIDDDLKYDASEYYGKPVGEEVYMSYRPGKGQMDETTKGKTPPDEYTEDTSLIRGDKPAEGEVMDTFDGVPDDVLKEVEAGSGNVPESFYTGPNPIKKANGGRIGYAGGKKVAEEVIKKANKKLGKKSVTTADKIDIPKETLLRDMFTDTNKRLNKKREMTVDEYEDFVEEVGGADQLEAYNFDGTVGDAERILKEQENNMAYMYEQYKMGKLDPVAGDKSPARKRFLEKKMEESLMSGDSKLMTREEIDELYNFDLGTEMEAAKKASKIDDDIDISQGMIDLDEMNFTKNAQAAKNKMDNMDVNQKIKEGVASIMSDTSPAALEKSIEVDNLMLKYPGMDNALAEQIATSEPIKKADLIAMVEQTFKLSEQGKSGDEIIEIFKNTTRTKQATGGLASILR